MESHSCRSIVVCCIDFRFQEFIRVWTDQNLGKKSFDLVGFAGGIKSLDVILNQIDISVRLHNISEVVLIQHEDCGAYGGLGTPEKHAADLMQAKASITNNYPNLLVKMFYLHLNGDFKPVGD